MFRKKVAGVREHVVLGNCSIGGRRSRGRSGRQSQKSQAFYFYREGIPCPIARKCQPNAYLRMQISESIVCPFCGQRFELAIDTSVAEQQFTTDCEICCRPFEVRAE